MNQVIQPPGNRTGAFRARARAVLFHIVLMIAAATGGAAFAQSFEDGRQAYKRDDFAQARAIFQSLADKGDARAQFNLALLYDEGEGAPKDAQKAAFWYRKAAEQGHREAQFNLGQMYSVGLGVPKDPQQAYFWWLLASAEGEDEATNNRKKIESLLTPEQREKTRAEAAKWRPRQP